MTKFFWFHINYQITNKRGESKIIKQISNKKIQRKNKIEKFIIVKNTNKIIKKLHISLIHYKFVIHF